MITSILPYQIVLQLLFLFIIISTLPMIIQNSPLFLQDNETSNSRTSSHGSLRNSQSFQPVQVAPKPRAHAFIVKTFSTVSYYLC